LSVAQIDRATVECDLVQIGARHERRSHHNDFKCSESRSYVGHIKHRWLIQFLWSDKCIILQRMNCLAGDHSCRVLLDHIAK